MQINRRPKFDELPDILYIKELAEFLGCSERAVRHHVDKEHIKSERVGGRIIIPKRNIAHLVLGSAGTERR